MEVVMMENGRLDIDVLFICRSIGAEDCWSLSLRRGLISNNRRGPGQTDVPIDHESWHSKDAITVFVAWHYSIINLDLPTPTVLGFRLAYVFTVTCDPYNHAGQQDRGA